MGFVRAAAEASPFASEAAAQVQQSIIVDEAGLQRLPPAALQAAQQLSLGYHGRLLASQRRSSQVPSQHLAADWHSGRWAGLQEQMQIWAGQQRDYGSGHARAAGGVDEPLQLVLAAEACATLSGRAADNCEDVHSHSIVSITDGSMLASDQRLPSPSPAPDIQSASAAYNEMQAPWQDPAGKEQSTWPETAWPAPSRSPQRGDASEASGDQSSQWSDTASETSSSSVWSELSVDDVEHSFVPLTARSSQASAPQARADAPLRPLTFAPASLPLTGADRLHAERHAAGADALWNMGGENLAPGSRDCLSAGRGSQRPPLTLPPVSLPLTLAAVQHPAAFAEWPALAAGSAEHSEFVAYAPAAHEPPAQTSLPLTRASLLRVQHPEDESPAKGGARRRASPGSLRVEALSECGLSSEDEDNLRPQLAPLGMLAATLSPVLGTLLPPPAFGIPAEHEATLPSSTAATGFQGGRAEDSMTSAGTAPSGSHQGPGAAGRASAVALEHTGRKQLAGALATVQASEITRRSRNVDVQLAATAVELPSGPAMRGGVPSQASEDLPFHVIVLQRAGMLLNHPKWLIYITFARHRVTVPVSNTSGAALLLAPSASLAERRSPWPSRHVAAADDAPPAQHRLARRPRDLKEAGVLFHLRMLAVRCLKVTSGLYDPRAQRHLRDKSAHWQTAPVPLQLFPHVHL